MTHDPTIAGPAASDLPVRRRTLFGRIIALDPVALASTELPVDHLGRIDARWPPGSRGKPADGESGIGRSSVHAGAGIAVLSRRSAATRSCEAEGRARLVPTPQRTEEP